MFNNAIYSTTLTSDAADRLFSHITSLDAPDNSFVSTMRALLHKRCPQNETAWLVCNSLRYSAHEITVASIAQRSHMFADAARLTR